MDGTTFRALKVTSQVATPGAESAVYDCKSKSVVFALCAPGQHTANRQSARHNKVFACNFAKYRFKKKSLRLSNKPFLFGY